MAHPVSPAARTVVQKKHILKQQEEVALIQSLLDRPVVLIGLMGAGKTSLGKRLAAALDMGFTDTDDEIEKAAGMPISDIFTERGEAEFRRGEREVIKRLLSENTRQILAFGGGAFMDQQTRKLAINNALVIWLDIDLDQLVKRVKRRSHRPLLRDKDPEAVLATLAQERNPIYQQAQIRVTGGSGTHIKTLSEIIHALNNYLQ